MEQNANETFARAQAAHKDGNHARAEALYLEVLAARPGNAKARMLLGAVAMETGRAEAAAALMAEALALNPELPHGHYNLGLALLAANRPVEAQRALLQALTRDKDDAEVHMDLGNALMHQGRPTEALALYRKAAKLAPYNRVVASAGLMALQYAPGLSEKDLFQTHTRVLAPWNGAAARAPKAALQGGRPLRVGLLSPDLRRHPVGYFMAPWLEARTPDALHVTCYADSAQQDDMSARLKNGADAWRDTAGLDDAALAEAIGQDGIQILVDLAGHTRDNRFPLFAARAAPVQATWAGYVGATGVGAMDYLITDAVQTPDGSAAWYGEAFATLPECYVCYAPPANVPAVSELPALRRGELVFGCLNGMPKLNPGVLKFWAGLVQEAPGGRLLLANRQLGEPALRDRVMHLLRNAGLPPDRLELHGGAPIQEFMALYSEIDVALDPFPYSGGLTTLESLAMGVPVLGVRGKTFAGRHTASHMTAVGLGDWVAQSPALCLEKARALACDLESLAGLRSTLRQRLLASPLCDGGRFSRHLEQAFAAMWRQHCAGERTGFAVPATEA